MTLVFNYSLFNGTFNSSNCSVQWQNDEWILDWKQRVWRDCGLTWYTTAGLRIIIKNLKRNLQVEIWNWALPDLKQEWLPLEHNIPSSQWSLHCNWYYSGLHWDSWSTWKMTCMWCLFYSLHNNSKSLWTLWGQELALTLNFHCIIALQLWQHTGLNASWSRRQHWLTTVYCQLLLIVKEGHPSAQLRTTPGRHVGWVTGLICRTLFAQLKSPNYLRPSLFCDVTQHTSMVGYWCSETV